MLKNASFLAIVAVHTAENEPPKVLKNAKKVSILKVAESSADADENEPFKNGRLSD